MILAVCMHHAVPCIQTVVQHEEEETRDAVAEGYKRDERLDPFQHSIPPSILRIPVSIDTTTS